MMLQKAAALGLIGLVIESMVNFPIRVSLKKA